MKWFTNMKLAAKLVSAFLIVCAITAAVGLSGIRNMGTINAMADLMYQNELRGLSFLKDAALDILYVIRNEKNTVLATSLEERKTRQNNHATYIARLDENLRNAQGLFRTTEGQELFARLIPAVEEWKEVHERVLNMALSEGFSEQRESVALSEGLAREKANIVEQVIDDLTQRKENNARLLSEQTAQIYRGSLKFMIGLVAIGVLIGLILGLILTRHIVTAVGGEPVEIEKLTRQVADGDLSVSFKSGRRRDTGIYASLKDMVKKLNSTMRSVQTASAQVAGSSEELSASAQQLSAGAQSQASTLEETSAAMEELAASVEQVADHAQSQAASVEEATAGMTHVQSSAEAVRRTLEAVAGSSHEAMVQAQGGAEAVRQAVEAIRAISASSERIAGIVGVISDIADQTNLLALNASIEAARAGEHGRGFAVVAQEVSKLADRSASSTKEIEALIRESGKSVASGVQIAQGALEAMEKISAGSKKAHQAVEELGGEIEAQLGSIGEVARSSETIAEMSQSISAATEEQTTNARQVSKAIENVNDLTQQAASAAEEMSAATEELSGLAQSLQRLVEQFRLAEERMEAKKAQAEAGNGRILIGHTPTESAEADGVKLKMRIPESVA